MSTIARTFKSWAMGAPSLVFGNKPSASAHTTRIVAVHENVPSIIKVCSHAFGRQQAIPRRHMADGENLSPPLNWSDVPPAARALALIVEDRDTRGSRPFVHWLAYNILPDDTDLPEGIPPGPILRSYCLLQGLNSFGKYGYVGAAPPPGDAPHQYHFQLLALNRVLPLGPGANRATLLKAMAGHVIARGDLIGTYSR